MALAKRVQLFYDVLSPYSWIAFEVMCRYRSRWNINLDLCPFYLAGVMGGSENRPPGVVPAKATYMVEDIKRLARFYQIPLQQLSNPGEVLFSKGSLKAQRLLTATKITCPENLESLSRQLWMRVWSRDEDITEEASLRAAGEKAGLSRDIIDNLIGQTSTPKVKEELKQVTQDTLDLGSFGAPFIVAHLDGGQRKECFFGSDRFELLASILGEKYEGPLTELKAKL